MRMLLVAAVGTLGLSFAAPALAQGVYIGPGGVGITTGAHPYGYARGRDRERFVDGPRQEGRSVYRENRRTRARDN